MRVHLLPGRAVGHRPAHAAAARPAHAALLWLGLIASVGQPSTSRPKPALLGAMAGYCACGRCTGCSSSSPARKAWATATSSCWRRIGAWVGLKGILPTILLSSVVGAIIGSIWLAMKGRDRATPIPFGPYLAIAGWIAFFWGESLVDAYLRFFGLKLTARWPRARPVLRDRLTGGIASGKSAVTRRLFATRGIRWSTPMSPRARSSRRANRRWRRSRRRFGADVLQADGALDRARLARACVRRRRRARRARSDPASRASASRCTTHARRAPAPTAIVAIPLLAEGGGRAAYPWLDRILVVDVPPRHAARTR